MEQWQNKIEQEIKELSKSTNDNTIAIKELSSSIKMFIELSVKSFEDKIENCEEKLEDHEIRIRSNTKFVYQAMAIISVASVALGIILKVIK